MLTTSPSALRSSTMPNGWPSGGSLGQLALGRDQLRLAVITDVRH